MKRIIVCCEGKSEHLYIQQLNTFMESWSGDNLRSLFFFPICVDCGDFTPVKRIIQETRKSNPRTEIQVWVDYDLYHPNRKNNKLKKYLSRPQGIPVFHFSFQNFEDFLILHYPPETLLKWELKFNNTGHFSHPLHGKDYHPIFKTIVPGYEKGLLPAQFVNAATLGNLKRNLPNRPIPPPPGEPGFKDFATFLLAELETAHPDIFTPHA